MAQHTTVHYTVCGRAAFFDNGLLAASRMLLAGARGSFGLVLSHSLDAGAEVVVQVTYSAPTLHTVAPPRLFIGYAALGLWVGSASQPHTGPRSPYGRLHEPCGVLCHLDSADSAPTVCTPGVADIHLERRGGAPTGGLRRGTPLTSSGPEPTLS